MASRTARTNGPKKRVRRETVDALFSRMNAHEENSISGRASGPPQARNYGNFSPSSTRGVSGQV